MVNHVMPSPTNERTVKAMKPVVEVVNGYECSGNSAGRFQGLSSCGKFTGVRLRDVLKKVGVGAEAREVVFFGLGFDPDGVAVGAEEIVGLGLGDDTAADGEDATFVFAHHAFECAAFDGAVAGLTVERKDIGERHAGFFFDFAVEFDEGDVKRGGEFLAEGGFAGAAKTDQGDAIVARRCFRRREFG